MTELAESDLSTIHGGKVANPWACYGTSFALGLAAGLGNQDNLGQGLAISAAAGVANGYLNPACQPVPAPAKRR